MPFIPSALIVPDSQWSFCPSIPAASLFLSLFLLTTLPHLIQAIYHKKPYCTILVLSGTLQTLNYIFRILSIQIQLISVTTLRGLY